MSQLEVGDVIQFEGREQIVVMVNDCRARVIPTSKRHVEFSTVMGDKLAFAALDSGSNISPNSTVPVIARMGRSGAMKFLGITPTAGAAEKTNSGQEEKTNTMKTVTDKTKRRGGLAAEGPLLKGAPTVKDRPVEKVDTNGHQIFVANCSDQKGQVKNKLVRCTSYAQALRALSAKHGDGAWMVIGTDADVTRFDYDAVTVEEPKKKQASNKMKRPSNPYDAGLWDLLEAGGQTLRQMADAMKAYWKKQGNKIRAEADAMKWLKVAIDDMKAKGLEPKFNPEKSELEKVNRQPLKKQVRRKK